MKTYNSQQGTKKMQHYKIKLETGKKLSQSRTLYVRVANIADAMQISSKIRKARLCSITQIDFDAYMKGVDKKYVASI